MIPNILNCKSCIVTVLSDLQIEWPSCWSVHIVSVLTLSFYFQVRQKPPAGRSSRQQTAGSTGGSGSSSNSVSGGGGSSGASSSSSSTRASPAGTIRAPTGHQGRPALVSNFSLDDITAQLEQVNSSINIHACRADFWTCLVKMNPEIIYAGYKISSQNEG